MNARKLSGLIAAGCLAVAAAAPAVRADGGDRADRHVRLTGVWHISGQPINCATGQPLPVAPITGIIAFHAGGTSTESGPTATPRTPGLGTWERVGRHQFNAVATVLTFDVNGLPTGSLVVRRTITVEQGGDSFTAPTRTTITDASGIVTERCATAEAVRAAK
ncbi:MAG TPA: hypothetical protein VJQ52_06775 [Steroidobacteraceae bacterium]|nr:hypothetical protein [Steroidobacteraceae bacterium]